MDWKNNQWVGIGAAALLVLAIVGIFTFRGAPGGGKIGTLIYTFKCKSTGETFNYTSDQIESMSTEDFAEYMEPYGTPAKCDKCGDKDAERNYFCPKCEEWYPYEPKHDMGGEVICPKGHEA